MALFETWNRVSSELMPGRRYRVNYGVVCLNAVTNAEFANAFSSLGIVTDNPDVSGPIEGAFNSSDMYFSVLQRMPLAEFLSKFALAFHNASQGSWMECSAPDVSAVEELVETAPDKPGAGSNPVTDFLDGLKKASYGAAFTLVLILVLFLFFVYRGND